MKRNGSQRPTHPSHYHPYTTPAAKVAADNSLRSNATPEIARGVIESGHESLLPNQQDNTLRKPDNLPDPEHIISQRAQNPNLVKKPEQVQLSMHISALKCTVSWEFPALMAQLKYTQKIEVNSGDMRPVTNSKWMEAHITTFQFETVPGKIYSIRLRIVDDRRVVVARGHAKCKAVFSREEMDKLMDKAVTSIGNSSKMKEFHDLQRCKPSHYWEHIRLYGNGIMRVYTKDNNGQAASPINGQIKDPFRFFVNGIVWVEIYYTEDVPLEYGELSPITAVGAGTSRIGGLPHNKSCRTCNLYPDSSPSNNVKELKDRQAINQHDQHDNNTTNNTSNPSSMLGTNQSTAIARTSYSPQNFNNSKSSNREVVPGKVNSSADHSRAGQARAQLDKKILVIVLSDEEDEKKEETQTRILQKAVVQNARIERLDQTVEENDNTGLSPTPCSNARKQNKEAMITKRHFFSSPTLRFFKK